MAVEPSWSEAPPSPMIDSPLFDSFSVDVPVYPVGNPSVSHIREVCPPLSRSRSPRAPSFVSFPNSIPLPRPVSSSGIWFPRFAESSLTSTASTLDSSASPSDSSPSPTRYDELCNDVPALVSSCTSRVSESNDQLLSYLSRDTSQDDHQATRLETFISSIAHSSRKDSAIALSQLQASLPFPLREPATPLQMVSLWHSQRIADATAFTPSILEPSPLSANLYKKVADKVRPVATTLPENFRIIRRHHPDPLAGMPPLPVHPPDFVPTGRFTQERRDQMALGKNLLWPEEAKLAEWIVCTHNSAFAWTDEERGTFDPKYFEPIKIPHIAHTPWALRQGPIPRGILDQVTQIIQNKWKSGVYEPSSSSYNSRWFCVLKKDKKSLRLVHSLEPLNAVTIKNAAMPPYTEVVAEDFAGRSIYTTLDLYVSFDQRQLHPDSRDMTTFTTPLGAFRLTVLPMGWTNSPAVLQGDITHILRPEIPHTTQPFIDDVPIKGQKTRYELPDGSFETIPGNSGIRRFVWEHLESVHRVIQRVKAYGATFSGTKAFIGVPQANILGHICTYEGRVIDPSRVQSIKDWPVPVTVSDVRAFLGVCGVSRHFIKDYTLVARPLIRLTRKDVLFEFGPEQLEAMDRLKDAIINSSAIRPLDYESDLPVYLSVDSCANGAGYILSQQGEKKKRYPSRYGSITFNDRKSRYSQAKLELYGLFRSLKETQLYTIGVKKLIVEMDAKFIKGMISNPTLHPNDAINRWIAAILLFDFDLVHIPAEKHTGADGLLRRRRAAEDSDFADPDELDDWLDSSAGFFIDQFTPASPLDPAPPLSFAWDDCAVFLARTGRSSSPESPPSSSRSSRSSSRSVPSSRASSRSSSLAPSSSGPDFEIPRSDKAIRRDIKLDMIRQFLETLKRPPDLTDERYRQFIHQAKGYFTLRGKLFRKVRKDYAQLVLDVARRPRVIKYAHDTLGHKGIYATTRNILLRFWWPHINEDVRWYVSTCHECQVRQTRYFHIPPILPTVPNLFRKVHIDTMFMPKTGNYRYIIHARCAMISYPEARAITSDSTKVITDFVVTDLLCRWGGISEIVTDNGAALVAVAEDLAKRYGINSIKISGYNSQANGVIEAKHFDLREAIMKTCRGNESRWRLVLPQVLWAERVTVRKATGFSPYYMAHGVHPVLPFDIVESTYLSPPQDFGMTTEDLVALRAQQLAKRPEDLARIRESVTEFRRQNLERFEKQHESRIVDFDFKPGALVLVRNSAVEKSLNSKSKSRYMGPVVVVRRTKGSSYVVAELDGAQWRHHVAAFRLIPYFPRTRTDVELVSNLPEEDEDTQDDPDDVAYMNSLEPEDRTYLKLFPPSV